MKLDWLLFALLVVAIGVVGIGIGLFLAGRLSRWGERSVAQDDGAFMTPVGAPDEDAGEGDAGPAGEDAGDGGGGGDGEGDGGGGGDRD
jgi:hypothetical protein